MPQTSSQKLGWTSLLILVSLGFLLTAPALRAAGSGAQTGPSPEVEVYNQGVALLKKGNFAAAQVRFQAALELREEFPEAHNNLAYSLRKQGKEHYAAALSHYNRALELEPRLPEALMYRGALYVLMGDQAAAQKDLEALRGLNDKLADELAWVIENGGEKEGSQAGVIW